MGGGDGENRDRIEIIGKHKSLRDKIRVGKAIGQKLMPTLAQDV